MIKFIARPLAIILGLIILLLLCAAIFSCNSSKHISKETIAIDSSYIHELESNIRVLQTEIDHLQRTIHEMEYTGVVFDNDCDSVLRAALLRAGCNVDSINAVLSVYQSKIISYSNGMVEAQGRIRSFTMTKMRQEQLISDLKKQKDSLAAVKNKVDVKYEKVTETKEKVVKRGIGGLMWGLLILLIIAAFVAGFWVCWKYKDDIQEQLDAEEKYS